MLDSSHRGLDVAVTGNHYDWKFGVFLLDGIEQLQTVEFAALEPDIKKDQIWASRRYRRQRFIAVARRPRVVALILQDARDKIANIGLIVDYQNFRDHHVTRTGSWAFSEPAGSTLPAAAKRTRTQAPRWPGIFSAASRSSMLPPCSSTMRPTMARPSPVPFSRVVTYGSSSRLRFAVGKPMPLSTTSITMS